MVGLTTPAVVHKSVTTLHLRIDGVGALHNCSGLVDHNDYFRDMFVYSETDGAIVHYNCAIVDTIYLPDRDSNPGLDIVGEYFTPQSGMEVSGDTDVERYNSGVKMQTVTFVDTPQQMDSGLMSYVDETMKTQDSDDVSLQDFLKRPVRVFTTTWAVGSDLALEIDPWTLFFENKRVSNRLTNFNLMRCDLKVKFVINGNPFYYSRALVSYHPLYFWDDLSPDPVTSTQDIALQQQSQKPHIFLDPCKSEGGTLSCPFFYYKNYMSVPDGNWNHMGSIFINSFDQLRSVGDGTGRLEIAAFAWAENVSLSVPTHLNASGLTPQSGREVDEANEGGTISGPATTISNMAATAAAVPVIRPYAMATSKVAEGVANIAKLFGMSRPPMTAEPTHMRPTSVGSLALTNAPVRTEKLTVDDKQEITIDPRISGLDMAEDPMAIAAIARKETFMGSFTWRDSELVDSLLVSGRVKPLYRIDGPLTGTETSHCYASITAAALPFNYWTGCIKFRFQIMKSAFHRGRLRFVYDPNYIQPSPAFDPEFNIQYSEIIDISEKDDFSITIHNSQPTPILPTGSMDFYSQTAPSLRVQPFSDFDETANGAWGLYVLNELTSPGSSQSGDIWINVFVSAGEDFEVYGPNDVFKNYGFFQQSGLETHEPGETQSGEPGDTANRPEQNAVSLLGICDTVTPNLNKVFFGESVKSFRSLAKRYNFWSVLQFATNGGSTEYKSLIGQRNLYPYFRGGAPSTAPSDDISSPQVMDYNLCNTTIFHWLIAGFQGFRGGMRYKLISNSNYNNIELFAGRSTRGLYRNEEFLRQQDASLTTIRSSYIDDYQTWNGWAPHGAEGTAFSSGKVNPTIDIEVPYYSRWRFVPGKQADFIGLAGEWSEGWKFAANGKISGGLNASLQCFSSCADDFQAYLWTGLPPVWNSGPIIVVP